MDMTTIMIYIYITPHFATHLVYRQSQQSSHSVDSVFHQPVHQESGEDRDKHDAPPFHGERRIVPTLGVGIVRIEEEATLEV